jgi:hypothetical protein
MDSAHVFEPNFHGVSSGKRGMPDKSLPETVARAFFCLLERFYLCHAPRILNAYCLTEESGRARNDA